MFVFLLIIIAIIVAITLFKKSRQGNRFSKKDILNNGESIYKTYRLFLNSLDEDFSSQELQKVMCFIEGFDNLNEKEQTLKNKLVAELGYTVMDTNPHIYVKINNKELELFIYTCDNYAVQLNSETKELEISRIR